MARTALSTTAISGGTSVGVGFTEFLWTAADAVNFNSFASTGKEILLIYNSGATARLCVLYKVAGRVEISIPGGDLYTTGQLPTAGFKQSDNKIWVDAPHAEIMFAVLVLP